MENKSSIQNYHRNYLTQSEVDVLINSVVVSGGAYSFRDRVLLLVLFRHGLRRSEASNLQWADINFKESSLFVHRLKNGNDGTHPIKGDELRLLRRLKRETDPYTWVFLSRNSLPLSPRSISRIVSNAGVLAGFDFRVHAHMLRHGCGYYLANKGIPLRIIQDYLGHKRIDNTVRYTQLAPNKFKGLWD